MPRKVVTSSQASLDAVATAKSSDGSSNLSFNHTVGSGSNRMLAVSISCQDSNHNNLPVTNVTFENIALTKAYSAPQGTGNVHSEIWFMMSPPSGTGSININTVGNIWIGAISSSWTGIFQQTTTTTTPGSGIPASAIVSFDMMKFQKDTSQNQMTAAGITNLMNLVKNNFPGVTHIACSTMLNSTAEINAVNPSNQIGTGSGSAPLTQEAYTDLWFQGIHNAGYSILLRNVDGFIDSSNVGGNSGDYNLIVQSNTPQHWVDRIIAFLTLHKANIRNGDVVGCDPEVDGHINYGGGANPIDSGSHAYTSDYNSFWQLCYQQVATWATSNGYTNIVTHQSCNGTSVNNSAPAAAGGVGNPVVVDGVTILNGGSQLLQAATLAITKAINVDWYNWQENSIGQPPPDQATYIAWYKASLDYWYLNIYAGKYPIMIQEWGDTRGTTSGSIQSSDPNLTGNLYDQVFLPFLRSGEMYAVNGWNFFDTPQEGIINAQGDNIGYVNGGGAISLNPKGAYLATIFQKWFGSGSSGTTTTTTTGADAVTSSDSQSSAPTVTINTVASTTLIIDALSSESAIAASNQILLGSAQNQAYENVSASYEFVTHSGNTTIVENTSGNSVFSLTAASFQTTASATSRQTITRSTTGVRSTAGVRTLVS